MSKYGSTGFTKTLKPTIITTIAKVTALKLKFVLKMSKRDTISVISKQWGSTLNVII